ncbi:hypothetical protein Lal_00017792 [Lupinus albus]|nr:hypothetical protein Lal_00017792 [Lupinus albus]
MGLHSLNFNSVEESSISKINWQRDNSYLNHSQDTKIRTLQLDPIILHSPGIHVRWLCASPLTSLNRTLQYWGHRIA